MLEHYDQDIAAEKMKVISMEQVRSGLRRIKKKKSAGPEGSSADQICWVIHYIIEFALRKGPCFMEDIVCSTNPWEN